MKQYDKACEAYENASRSSDMYLEPLRKLTEVYGEMGNAAKRLECMERLNELSPLNVERKLAMGELYLQLNRLDDAKKIFDQALVLSDREASEYVSGVAFRVADVYMDKDPQVAAAFLQRGLEAKKGVLGQGGSARFQPRGHSAASRGPMARGRPPNTPRLSRWPPMTRVCTITWLWPLPRARILNQPEPRCSRPWRSTGPAAPIFVHFKQYRHDFRRHRRQYACPAPLASGP